MIGEDRRDFPKFQIGTLPARVIWYIIPLKKAIDSSPTFADAHYRLGIALWRMGSIDDSIQSFRWAVATRPDYAEASYLLGSLLIQQGEIEGALDALQLAIRKKPEFPEAHYSLGTALRRHGRLQEAAQELEIAEAQRLRKESVQAAKFRIHKGIKKLQSGQPEEAVLECEGAIRLCPEYAPGYYQLSLVLEQMGRPKEATEALDKARQLDPGLQLSRSPRSPQPQASVPGQSLP